MSRVNKALYNSTSQKMMFIGAKYTMTEIDTFWANDNSEIEGPSVHSLKRSTIRRKQASLGINLGIKGLAPLGRMVVIPIVRIIREIFKTEDLGGPESAQLHLDPRQEGEKFEAELKSRMRDRENKRFWKNRSNTFKNYTRKSRKEKSKKMQSKAATRPREGRSGERDFDYDSFRGDINIPDPDKGDSLYA